MKAVIRTHYVAAYWLRNLQYAWGLFDCLQSTAQSVYHSVSRGQLGIVVQMCVDVSSGRKITMPQPFLNLLHGNAVRQQE